MMSIHAVGAICKSFAGGFLSGVRGKFGGPPHYRCVSARSPCASAFICAPLAAHWRREEQIDIGASAGSKKIPPPVQSYVGEREDRPVVKR